MILVDANLLIYAHVSSFPQHERSRNWFDEQLNTESRIGLPWASLLAFLRVVTNPRAFTKPIPIERAWRQVEDWLAHPSVWIPLPGDEHQALLAQMLQQTGAGANLVPDADLAALALEHGLILCSADGDFARFRGLKWSNPLSVP